MKETGSVVVVVNIVDFGFEEKASDARKQRREAIVVDRMQ